MEQTAHHDSLRLHAESPDARPVITAAVDRVVASHPERPYLQVILDGEAVPADVVAALVTGLRRVRERGGAIEVVPASTPVRDALALTGLDRVFAFPLNPDQARRPRRRMLERLAAASFAAVVALVGTPTLAAADHPTDPAAILAQVEERNPTLSSYRGRMHVDLRMTSFPFLMQHLDGTTYFKRPSNYEVVFDKVPPLAKGFDKMFADVGDPADWQRRFVVTYEGEKEFNGRKDVQLRLVQRVRGMIDHETVLIDPNQWTIDSIRYDYYNGGHITMNQTFREMGGYLMLAEQNAEIAIPYAKAVAHGTYSDYKTNVAIDDAVFTKKNGK
ncbi:MAG TPA: STAS domain-containing protein [Candidatus Elarobacter sp.]|nr:STAS domain-containing protein [Candidatus Elarobacter sp.]